MRVVSLIVAKDGIDAETKFAEIKASFPSAIRSQRTIDAFQFTRASKSVVTRDSFEVIADPDSRVLVLVEYEA